MLHLRFALVALTAALMAWSPGCGGGGAGDGGNSVEPGSARQVIAEADLDPRAQLRDAISFATLRPNDIKQYTGLEYESVYAWGARGPEEAELARELADEGLGTRQEIQDSFYETGLLRVHTGRLSWGRREFCPPGLYHNVRVEVLVFGDASGARVFFDSLVPAETPSGSAGMTPRDGVRHFSKPESGDCLMAWQTETQTGTRRIQYETGNEVAWVADGPFIVRIVEKFGTGFEDVETNTADAIDPQPRSDASDYATDQVLKLREHLPEYFE